MFPAVAVAVGSKLGPYEILEKIGEGGMGTVYKAYHRQLARMVAIKVLRPGSQGTERDRDRFFAEAQLTAQLHHPNIVAVHDMGTEDGRDYLVMDFIEGEGLDVVLRCNRPAPRKALEIMREVALAVDYAHQNGVVHRDLKPGNIMLEKHTNRPLVMDFGLAKNIRQNKGLTRSGEVLGTPKYMSPEQAEGKVRAISPRSDVYALGAVLYEMLSGYPAVDGATPFNIVYNIIHNDIIPLRQRNPNLSVDMETICRKSLEKDPSRRYPSAKALADDIDRFLAGEAIWARATGFWYHAWKKIYRYRIAVGAGVCVVVIAVPGIYLLWQAQKVSLAKERQATKTKMQQELQRQQKQQQQEDLAEKQKREALDIALLDRIMADIPDLSNDMGNEAVKGSLGQDLETFRQAVADQTKMLKERIREKFKSVVGEEGKGWLKHWLEHGDRHSSMFWKQNGESQMYESVPKLMRKDYAVKIGRLRGDHIIARLAIYLDDTNAWRRFVAIEMLGEMGDAKTKVEDELLGEVLLAKLNAIDVDKKLQETDCQNIEINLQTLNAAMKSGMNLRSIAGKLFEDVAAQVTQKTEFANKQWEEAELLVEALGKLRYKAARITIETIRAKLQTKQPTTWLKMGIAYRWLDEQGK
jgi:hypothetical protein